MPVTSFPPILAGHGKTTSLHVSQDKDSSGNRRPPLSGYVAMVVMANKASNELRRRRQTVSSEPLYSHFPEWCLPAPRRFHCPRPIATAACAAGVFYIVADVHLWCGRGRRRDGVCAGLLLPGLAICVVWSAAASRGSVHRPRRPGVPGRPRSRRNMYVAWVWRRVCWRRLPLHSPVQCAPVMLWELNCTPAAAMLPRRRC
jgi:hypothetical protein